MNQTSLSPKDSPLTQLATVPARQTSLDGSDWFPPVDIAEDAEDYLFKIDLPEINPDDLRLAVEEDGLVIRGERANLGGATASFFASSVLTGTLFAVSRSRTMPTGRR